MADPYNPYISYPTPTPGGVSYYPPAPDEQSYHQGVSSYEQQQYNNVDYGGHGVAPPGQTYAYPPQSSTYHLQPDGYQNNAPSERSYTPVEQPDYLGPVSAPGMPPYGSGGKVPENLGYYESHPADVPRYTPSHSPRPPAPPVYVSDADNAQSHDGKRDTSDGEDLEGDRGFGGSLAGGAAGYYFGHKKDHGLLGAIGGAIIGNLLEDKVKKRERSSSTSSSHGGHHSHHSHHIHHSHLGHGHHHHHHSHRHSRSRSHSRHRESDDY